MSSGSGFSESLQSKLFMIVAMLLFTACSSKSLVDHPTTRSALWVQNASEYDAQCIQVYSVATQKLNDILSEQIKKDSLISQKPYAIIVDVDETVLDNSPFQARMILKGSNYNNEDWNEWVNEAQAEAIAGAVDFLTFAASNDIQIFYITNRDADTEEATFSNLSALGFPLNEDIDVLLTKYEREDWNSSKINRRAMVKQNYEVIMMFGDDLNDFYDAKNVSSSARDQIVINNRDKWGNSWFILPNPIYGSWEQSIFEFQNTLTETERNKIILNSLNPKN
ncbi:5'-nucleotidase, lipoprotein e(P4) family [Balneola sp. MJW-20]|uniref:5'-nucleotidase, lipoprotein e(P4) family n=1 Tax=Gracilimonas aurantiaca TaxID=3234185 RepID=UPI003465605A